MFRSFHDLRDKKLFKFETEGINKIVIETEQTRFEMQKSGSTWSLLKPEEIQIKEFLGKDLLWAMKGMEFDSIIETSPAPESAGLTPPAYKISLWKNESEKFAELQVGALDGNIHYAQIEGQTGYFTVKTKYLDSFPLTLERFKINK
jgi:hypothetical protein